MLRHTYATRLFENHVPPKIVQHLLGHKSIQTTLDTYTDVLKKYEEKYIEKLDEIENKLNEVEDLDITVLRTKELNKIKDIVTNSHFTTKQKNLFFDDITSIEKWLELV